MPFNSWANDEETEDEDFYEDEEDEVYEVDTGEWEALVGEDDEGDEDEIEDEEDV